ncbi:MAG: hypothetical protein JNL75_08515 [Chitinophagales bacterium]|nr:hypothetical protein [Chitinophagales bacterium]
MISTKKSLYLVLLMISISNISISSDKSLLDKLKDLGDSSFDTTGRAEYLEYSQQNAVQTNTPTSFNSKNIEYIDNVHPQGEYSHEQARNQPFSDKIVRCFKIFFLKIK